MFIGDGDVYRAGQCMPSLLQYLTGYQMSDFHSCGSEKYAGRAEKTSDTAPGKSKTADTVREHLAETVGVAAGHFAVHTFTEIAPLTMRTGWP